MGSLLYIAALVLGCALLALSTYRAFVHVAANLDTSHVDRTARGLRRLPRNTAIDLRAHAH